MDRDIADCGGIGAMTVQEVHTIHIYRVVGDPKNKQVALDIITTENRKLLIQFTAEDALKIRDKLDSIMKGIKVSNNPPAGNA